MTSENSGAWRDAYNSLKPATIAEICLVMTHRSQQAETAASAVAESAALAMTNQHGDASKVFDALAALSDESEWQSIVFKMRTSSAEAHSVSDFVQSLNLKRGVTGYSLHVAPGGRNI